MKPKCEWMERFMPERAGEAERRVILAAMNAAEGDHRLYGRAIGAAASEIFKALLRSAWESLLGKSQTVDHAAK